MGTPIEPITFNLDISASEISGNKTFFISGRDRSTYSLNNDSSFNGFVQQLYYEVGDNIDISFNSNGQDISFIIFNPNLDISFVFDSNNHNYTISFGTYDNYSFGDSSLNAYGVFSSYLLKADTRDDLNTYISSKYNASEPRNRLQQFNRDDRRFVGNYDYIKSDATRIGVDGSGVNNDLIIQSVVNDIHIVTGDKQRTSIWGNLEVHGNISIVGKGVFLEKRVEGIAYNEEDLYINNQRIDEYLSAIVDNSLSSINQIINIHDTSLNDLDEHVSIHDASLNALQQIINSLDTSYVSDTSFIALQQIINSLDTSYATDASLNALQQIINNLDDSYASDASLNALQQIINNLDDSYASDASLNALQQIINNLDDSYASDASLNALQQIINSLDASYVSDVSFIALQQIVNNLDDLYASDASLNALQQIVNNINTLYASDASLNALQQIINNLDASYVSDVSFIALQQIVNNIDASYVSYSYFESSYNTLIEEISNITIDSSNLNIIPEQQDNSGKFLSTDGSNLYWSDICFSDNTITIQGTQGPSGEQGPIGPQGPPGEQGQQGIPGSTDICLNDYSDVSFNNVDISGILKLNNINISNKLTNIDSSLNNLIINNTNIVNPNNSISIGQTSNTQSDHSIAIGTNSGYSGMSQNSIAIGYKAGETNMGLNSIAIGNQAAMINTNNVENYIVLNAGLNTLDPSNSNAFYVKPIRNENNNYKLLYNHDSGEITYQLDSTNVNLTGGQDASFNNVDISGSLKINSSVVALKSDITTAIDNLIDNAPGNLDTLNELASALDNSSNFASVVTNKLSNIDSSLTYLDSKALDLTLGQDASFNNIDVASKITTLDITASGYYVGSRSVISGSAQGNFTDLELKNNNTSNLLAYGDTGDLSMNGTLSVNTINGLNQTNGVIIEGVTIQNNQISTALNGTISATNFNIGSQNVISGARQGNFRDLEIKNSLNNEVFLLQGDANNNLADLSMSGVFKLNNVNISDKLTSLDVSINDLITNGSSNQNINLTGGQDASFNNVDISGSLKINNFTFPTYDGISGQILKLDSSNNLIWSNDDSNSNNNLNNIVCLTPTSIVNIVDSSGNKYVLNGTSYDSNKHYGLANGNYKLTNIPQGHPIAILNNDVSNLISYSGTSLQSKIPFTNLENIYVKLIGNNGSNSYEFYSDIGVTNQISNFKLKIGKQYIFIATSNFSGHPFRLDNNTNYTLTTNGSSFNYVVPNKISIPYACIYHPSMTGTISAVSLNAGDSYNEDFYYGDVDITVNGDFGVLSVYCYYHGYMGGENLLTYSTLCQITNLTGYEDASFNNVDISGSLRLNNIDISGKLSQIDASINDLITNGTSNQNVNLTGGQDASFNNVDISGNSNMNNVFVNGIINLQPTNNLNSSSNLNNNDVSLNNVDISGILRGNQGTQINLGSHIIPTSNEAFDLGNAEYKIRHLFLSDNSLWIGDEHKIDVSNGELKFKKRKKDFIPPKIKDLSSNLNTIDDIKALSNKFDNISDLSSMKLNDWLLVNKEFKKLDSNVPELYVEDIFNDSSENWIQELNQNQKIVELENKIQLLTSKLNSLLPSNEQI
jgi:hypothetical protein